ncbi:hypothetical protein BCR41DRAFT_360378 [Lobosporangium transversale]|uniref:Uncharacterized protein n=1 Tax=Lobosporangium transversale TaxID=64571 RepID=A0A1Y2GE69_9FUNG|nr:hypothetical protein BCR41DRAFT_360378 [Lobosporangium transversale]ORZ07289.1 hypothetical protein BCR41DRAFT_360378 [Lobosporangium transversale]|eukprot:XP_021877952.1 hypothetical protein BCR41DRAFT_360378 [Lobosporangium transversale]
MISTVAERTKVTTHTMNPTQLDNAVAYDLITEAEGELLKYADVVSSHIDRFQHIRKQHQLGLIDDETFLNYSASKFKGNSEELSLSDFRARLQVVFARFPDALSSDEDKINYSLQ